MMGSLRAVVIGAGGRGWAHAEAYQACPGVSLVAVAEPEDAKAEKIAEKFAPIRLYKDYRKMLRDESPDVVAVCTWPALHKKMVIDAVRSGARLINAEKPMATTYGDALAMHKACQDGGVVCTYSHQRRFNAEFVLAKSLLRRGEIGELRSLEGVCPNLYDWGTHWFDMMFFFNDQVPALTVMGQVDVAHDSQVFGAKLDTSGISFVKFQNGVNGLMKTTSDNFGAPASSQLDRGGFLVIGSKGTMLVHASGCPLEIRRMGAAQSEKPDLSRVSVLHPDSTVAGIIDSVQSFRKKREPELSSRKALMATELIFATYESSRIRGRVTLPLRIKDNPLVSMMNAGEIGYTRKK